MKMLAMAIGLCLLLTACASHRRLDPAIAYRITHNNRGPLLLPPKSASPEALITRLEKARRQRSGKGCDVSGMLLKLSWDRRDAVLTVVPEAGLSVDPRLSGAIAVDTLEDLNRFRQQTSGLEAKGCLTHVEAAALLTRISQSLPLSPVNSYFLRYGAYPNSGFLDLSPQFRLKVTGVVHRGTLTGYENVIYSVKSRGVNRGIEIYVSSVEETINQKTERKRLPTQTYLDPVLPFARYFFLTRNSPADHDATMLSAVDPAPLDAASVAFAANASACATSGAVRCQSLEPERGAAMQMRIIANGKPQWVDLGDSVRDVLARAGLGRLEKPPLHLRVLRPYQNRLIEVRYDAAEGDILGLTLSGNEQLFW